MHLIFDLDDCSAASNNNIDFVYCDYGYGYVDLSKEHVYCKIDQFTDLIKLEGVLDARKY